ncbi:MAG: hypothetical protein ACFCUO_01925, partial [Rhodospirillales bacterium]
WRFGAAVDVRRLAALVLGAGVIAMPCGAAELVSVNEAGIASANGPSFNPHVNHDGRLVVFDSLASNLVANDANGESDVFVRDLRTATTTLVSVARNGTGSGNGASFGRGISADGRYVLFESSADDLVANDGNRASDVFVRDLHTGRTILASVSRNGGRTGNGPSFGAWISLDGRFVVFRSAAGDLVSGSHDRHRDLFVRDLTAGKTTLIRADRLDAETSESVPLGSWATGDGGMIVFDGHAAGTMVDERDGHRQVFVRDLSSRTTTLASVNRRGWGGSGWSRNASTSADGRVVVFQSAADDLVDRDGNGTDDVFVRDLETGTTALVSVNRGGTDSGNGASSDPRISPDGRFVVFRSLASDLVRKDSNGADDIFVHDRETGRTTLLSVNRSGGNSGRGSSVSPRISGDGRTVVFASAARDLAANDGNGTWDVFVASLAADGDGAAGLDIGIDDETDLAVEVACTPQGQITVDGAFTCDVGVRNLGPAPATAVRIYNRLTSDAESAPSVGDPRPSRGSCGPDRVGTTERASGGQVLFACDFGTLEPGADARVSYTVQAPQAMAVDNEIWLDGDGDIDASNDRAVRTLRFAGPAADLGVRTTVVDQKRWTSTTVLRFEVAVGNDGPLSAENVQLTTSLPLTSDKVTIAAEPSACVAYLREQNALRCEFNRVGTGISRVLTFKISMRNEDLDAVSGISSRSVVTSTTPDPFSANNSDTWFLPTR